MQGKLSEIDIRSILQLVELGQRTGELFVEAYPSQAVAGGLGMSTVDSREPRSLNGSSWFVFFLNGQIIYATDTLGNLSRLRDYLRRYRDIHLDTITAPAIAAINAPEYGYLWALLEKHLLTPAQGRSIIHGMVHETLFDLLSLRQGTFVFELGPPLAPQLTTLEIGPLVAKTMQQVQEWKQFHPHIQSPEQCPVISSPEQLREALPEKIFNALDWFADGQTSLRQIARYLKKDVLAVARAVFPYVQRGLIHLAYPTGEDGKGNSGQKPARSRDFDFWSPARPRRVVCIDDGVAVGKAVEDILSRHGYEATAIANPLTALSLVFQLNPDLILCDIAMPELDGYEICAMLRTSTAFRQTPIVMLTGKDGFIDRVKARMVGATDYLTKPFGESELLMLLEKYIGPGPGQIVDGQGNLLTNSSTDGIEINIT